MRKSIFANRPLKVIPASLTALIFSSLNLQNFPHPYLLTSSSLYLSQLPPSLSPISQLFSPSPPPPSSLLRAPSQLHEQEGRWLAACTLKVQGLRSGDAEELQAGDDNNGLRSVCDADPPAGTSVTSDPPVLTSAMVDPTSGTSSGWQRSRLGAASVGSVTQIQRWQPQRWCI